MSNFICLRIKIYLLKNTDYQNSKVSQALQRFFKIYTWNVRTLYKNEILKYFYYALKTLERTNIKILPNY
jgi:hypothetical protein